MTKHHPRLLLYSHDTYGLGHLRRTLAIAGRLARDLPQARQLLLTGSMVAGAFSPPAPLDLIKLPALSKRSSGAYTARALPLSLKEVIAWRQRMILDAVQAFKPDLVLVDKSPAGVEGELLPALRYLKTWMPNTALVLGMRDIEDDPAHTRAEWAAQGVPDLHDGIYDHLLYYGQRAVFDPVSAYGMSPTAAAKLIECGYLGRPADDIRRSGETIRRELGLGVEPLVLATVGGGGDGYGLIETLVQALAERRRPAPFHTVIVTGPLMSQAKRRLVRQAAVLPAVSVLEFTPDLFSYMAAADLVVGMAGYNTVVEALSLNKRLLLIPRTHPRQEQALRATHLAGLGLARVLLPEHLSAPRLNMALDQALRAEPAPVDLALDGLARVSGAVAGILGIDGGRKTEDGSEPEDGRRRTGVASTLQGRNNPSPVFRLSSSVTHPPSSATRLPSSVSLPTKVTP